jgi:hypothetical protein
MRSVDIWLEQTDEFILQSLNPCPEVVQDKEAFVRQVHTYKQGCGSGSELDLDSIGSVDPDPYSESGSGSRRAKMTHKS